MANSEQVLLESQTARTAQPSQIEEGAEELLNKAKALHVIIWQGARIAKATSLN